jgi:hypothetical protein
MYTRINRNPLIGVGLFEPTRLVYLAGRMSGIFWVCTLLGLGQRTAELPATVHTRKFPI